MPQRKPATGSAGRGELLAALRADIPSRIDSLRGELDARKLDAFLVTREVNVHYLTGFTGEDSVLLVGTRGGKSGVVLVTDFRYQEEAAESAPSAKTVMRKHPIMVEAARTARRRGWTKLGFELTGMLAADRDDLAREGRSVKRKRIRIKGVRGLLEALRAVKSPAEVEAIRRAVRVAERAGRTARSFFREGRTELEVARRVARRMEDLGAMSAAFPTIAAFDARGSLPHAKPGEARARRDSVLLLDWGARCDFYCSDLTRVFALTSIPKRLRGMHALVLEAQRAAIARIGPGVPAREVDAAARAVIRKAGWGKRFGHGAGHGIGLEVHEAPRLGARSGDTLRAGMVVTVEPGVYIAGRGGVRIEDDVVVTEDGAEVLSRMARDL